MKRELKSICVINNPSTIKNFEEISYEQNQIYTKYIPYLRPNRKSIYQIIECLRSRYIIEEDTSVKTKKIIEKEIISNLKLEKGVILNSISFKIENVGLGENLYKEQKQELQDLANKYSILCKEDFGKDIIPIKIDFEFNTDYISVHGSQSLADEIVILKGLNTEELNDKYQVVNYIKTLVKYGMLQ